MVMVANYPKLQSDWLRHELDPNLFRDQIVLVSGAGNLKSGSVLGKITASGKYTLYNPSASDGSETVAGILLDSRDATSADTPAVRVKANARVVKLELSWHANVDNDTKKNTGMTALAALGIVNSAQG